MPEIMLRHEIGVGNAMYIKNFLLCQYVLDDCMWAEITRKLITARNALDAALLYFQFCRKQAENTDMS